MSNFFLNLSLLQSSRLQVQRIVEEQCKLLRHGENRAGGVGGEGGVGGAGGAGGVGGAGGAGGAVSAAGRRMESTKLSQM